MKTAMRMVGMLVAAGLVVVSLVGCSSKTSRMLAMTDEVARRQAQTEQVLLELAKRGNGVVADALAAMPESGAVGWTKTTRAVRDSKNEPARDPKGDVVFETGEAIGKSNSMRDLGNLEEATMILGGLARNLHTGEVEAGAAFDGFAIYVKGMQISSTMSTDFASVWANASVEEKRAAADAVKAAYEARKGMIVEGINAVGDVVSGTLTQVLRATPYGAGLAVVEAIATVAGKETGIKIVEPMAPPAE